MNNLEHKVPDDSPLQMGESDDGFLDGRLNILQPRNGYRAGLDAVMVAAAIPASPGETVIEAGSGTGVASLCLLERVSKLDIHGLELNPDYAALARKNAVRNGFSDQFTVTEGDVAMPAGQRVKFGLKPGSFDHAFANPPFRDKSRSRAGVDEGRNLAHLLTPDALQNWIKFLVAMVRPKGTVTLILPGDILEDALNLLKGRAGNTIIYPLFPKSDEPAKRVIIQAVKGSRAAAQLLCGLTLHGNTGGYTDQAEAILRGNDVTPLANT